jgi:hypothetical protein
MFLIVMALEVVTNLVLLFLLMALLLALIVMS